MQKTWFQTIRDFLIGFVGIVAFFYVTAAWCTFDFWPVGDVTRDTPDAGLGRMFLMIVFFAALISGFANAAPEKKKEGPDETP